MCYIDLDPCEVWKVTEVQKCRKRHVCQGCYTQIPVGSHYWKIFTIYDGHASEEKECDSCHAIFEEFAAEDGHTRSVPSYMAELIGECVYEDVDDPKNLRYLKMLEEMSARGPQ